MQIFVTGRICEISRIQLRNSNEVRIYRKRVARFQHECQNNFLMNVIDCLLFAIMGAGIVELRPTQT
jgi:hypothetical protein